MAGNDVTRRVRGGHWNRRSGRDTLGRFFPLFPPIDVRLAAMFPPQSSLVPAGAPPAPHMPAPGPPAASAGGKTSLPARVVRGIAAASRVFFGLIWLCVGLAVLVTIPFVQMVTLGYVLEAEGRLARGGRLRDALPGLHHASRVGGVVIACFLVTLPVRVGLGLLADAPLVNPQGSYPVARQLVNVLGVLTVAHAALAILRGGRLRHFFRPIHNVRGLVRDLRTGELRRSWHRAVELTRSLRLFHLFWLGLRGYFGAGLWLVLPTTLIAVGRESGLAVIGGLMLVVVLHYVPFLQAHFAAEQRFRAHFEVRAARDRFARAPIAFFLAFLFTLLLALPLYVLKIEIVPRDALWLPAVLFIVTLLPTKLLTGWAYARASRAGRSHFLVRAPAHLLMIPVAVFYAFVVFLTQYTGWHGVLSLYEQHAFLLPVPF